MWQIFDEFYCYQQLFDWGEQGLGLGLLICQCILCLFDYCFNVCSWVGSGLMFLIILSWVVFLFGYIEFVKVIQVVVILVCSDLLVGLWVLCVDNDEEIFDGMCVLFGCWQVQVIIVVIVDQVLEKIVEWLQVMLVDYYLYDCMDGLDVLVVLCEVVGYLLLGVLLIVDGCDELKWMVCECGYCVLIKLIKLVLLCVFFGVLCDVGNSDV